MVGVGTGGRGAERGRLWWPAAVLGTGVFAVAAVLFARNIDQWDEPGGFHHSGLDTAWGFVVLASTAVLVGGGLVLWRRRPASPSGRVMVGLGIAIGVFAGDA